ncbi:MAG: 30S ribosomal protein S8 [Candidatus Paceibacterota bacterium]
MVTDSVADMLTQLRNAGAAQRFSVSLAHSNLLENIAKTLAEAGYVDTVSVEDKAGKPQLVIGLAYHDNGTSRITRARRLSKPSRRSYVGVGEIPNVRAGVGDVVLSTPEGILTGDKARQQHVGGEVLFEIW